MTVLRQMNSSEKLKNFLQGVLTEKELKEIPRRLEIIKMIKKGVPHQTIAERLDVGVATVTRGSRELHLGRFKYV
ncbi:hypothetical protein A3F34_02980 [Candidatus Roizmanbacteria bacterium RIFCSPHIGHO2_12_FULL_44_10]|uniref:Transcriptional regulator n=1 Tax=Candidatus Roizmanbacteria bacterium RIFCSPHIGHO2_12_FULL_44_10 TaxID=1802054 RepID=A0A1F7I8R2_9BACT|nr:MAG: hypothetical protein A3F34_02980 [Candidatus Roizmanbacteria bacterium RIFCSPHIGHO2_12_FULL_44_10]